MVLMKYLEVLEELEKRDEVNNFNETSTENSSPHSREKL
jgi:hypothetical protein